LISDLSPPISAFQLVSISAFPMSPRPRWLRRLAWFLAAACALLLGCYVFRAPLLTGLANAWIVNEAPEKADAIVVLGGGVEYRPFAAARLYKEGLAPKILIMDVDLNSTDKMELTQPERSVTRQILLQSGVPDGAIETVGHAVHSTYQESVGVKEWAKQNGAKRLLIATELFHTRRVRWLFHKQLKDAGIEVRLVAVAPPQYQATNWWQNEHGLIDFQNEWVKLPYYWLKY
jgi:uncharacterized SAM-binding protein YcdF (DUF218 family)